MINSLTAKARTALRSAHAEEFGTLVIGEEFLAAMKEQARDRADMADPLAEAVLILIVLATLGVNIDQLLADIFAAAELDRRGDLTKITESLLAQHLDPILG